MNKEETYKEKLQSLSFRSKTPKPKVSIDHTDTSVVTTTEHWNDRQDCHVNVQKGITMKLDGKEN